MMKLKELINLCGGAANCARIWGVTKESVSRMFARNSINRGLLIELKQHMDDMSSFLDRVIKEGGTEFKVSDIPTRRDTSQKKRDLFLKKLTELIKKH
jgi:3-isopropylmalate dehydratase small subunit